MTINEAIILLRELRARLSEVGFDKYATSVVLGIESLKRCRNFRNNSQTSGYMPLPGETEE